MPAPVSDINQPGAKNVSVTSPTSVWIIYAATVALFYTAAFFPEQRLWGINWYGFFGWQGPLLLLVLGIAVWFMTARVEKRPLTPSGETSHARYWWLSTLIGLVFLTGFVLFHARTHFLGDGYQLLSWLEGGVHFKTWEKGAFVVQSLLYALVSGDSRGDATLALRLASWGSGLVCIIASAVGSCLLFAENVKRLLMFTGLMSGGYALLFFGYFESYPIFVAAVFLYSLIGLLIAVEKCSRFWVLAPLALAGFFHIFAVGLIPSTGYLLLRDTPAGRFIGRWSVRTKLFVTAGLLVVAALVLWYFCSIDYFVRFTIVPPIQDRFTIAGYTMFSLKHLLDYANLLLVLVPSLPLLFWAVAKGGTKGLGTSVDTAFLLSMTVPTLIMVFIFNPGLGMPRDWDLFSFAGVPLTLLLFYVALSRGKDLQVRIVALLAIALNLIVLGPRVATQMIPEKSLALFDSYAQLDVERSINGRFWVLNYLQEQGDQAEYDRRVRMNRKALPHEAAVFAAARLLNQGRANEAKIELNRAIALAPCYEYAWYNLGNLYLNTGRYDSALVTLKIADAMLPFRPSVYERLAQVYFALGRLGEAEEYCRKTLTLSPASYTAMLQLVEIYDRRHWFQPLHEVWHTLENLPSPPTQALLDLTTLAVQRKDFGEASRWIERSRRLGVDSAAIQRMEGMIAGSRSGQEHP